MVKQSFNTEMKRCYGNIYTYDYVVGRVKGAHRFSTSGRTMRHFNICFFVLTMVKKIFQRKFVAPRKTLTHVVRPPMYTGAHGPGPMVEPFKSLNWGSKSYMNLMAMFLYGKQQQNYSTVLAQVAPTPPYKLFVGWIMILPLI